MNKLLGKGGLSSAKGHAASGWLQGELVLLTRLSWVVGYEVTGSCGLLYTWSAGFLLSFKTGWFSSILPLRVLAQDPEYQMRGDFTTEEQNLAQQVKLHRASDF